MGRYLILEYASEQPPGQAAFGAAGGAIGSVVGPVGSVVGPVGAFVGGLISGLIGGAIADLAFPYFFPPENDPQLPKPIPITKECARYRVIFAYTLGSERLRGETDGFGEISGFRQVSQDVDGSLSIEMRCHGRSTVCNAIPKWEPVTFLGFKKDFRLDPQIIDIIPFDLTEPTPTPIRKPLPFFPPFDMKLPDPAIPLEVKPPNVCTSDPCNLKMSNDLDELKEKFQIVEIQVTLFKECDPKTGKATFENQTITDSVSLLAANYNRKGTTIWNKSTANLYVELGATASTWAFTARVGAGGYYEVPFTYTGVISGIWDAANGSALVRELS